MKYVVGIPDKFSTNDTIRYYQDTRGDLLGRYGGCSDIFTSGSGVYGLASATRYDTLEAAQAWNDEFMDGKATIYPVES